MHIDASGQWINALTSLNVAIYLGNMYKYDRQIKDMVKFDLQIKAIYYFDLQVMMMF